MSAFARFCSLRHLDLNLLSAHQIPAGHAETGGCHLLDGGTAVLAAPCGVQTFIALPAFTGVGFSVKMIHGNGKGLMGFLRDGAIGHGAGLEPLYDLVYALHFLNGHRLL